MVFRKMLKNKWLEFCLLLGFMITVAMASSMPIYTDAILSRMLVKDLEGMQQKEQVYPGSLWAQMKFGNLTPDEINGRITQADKDMASYAGQFNLPVKEQVKIRVSSRYVIHPEDPAKADPNASRAIDIVSMSGLENHVQLIDGRFPASEAVNGVYEVMVTERALIQLKTVINNVFVLQDPALAEPVKVKPVGVFRKKADDDIYFRSDTGAYPSTLFMNESLFEEQIIRKGLVQVASSEWHIVLDYTQLTLHNVKDFVETSESIKGRIDSVNSSMFGNTYSIPGLKTIEAYFDRVQNLRMLIWSLNVPVLIMLGFYMYMVSELIISRQKNEIAVLRSRGAARWQIMLSYLAEGVLLGGIAFGVGPLIGLAITHLLGASNGFLEFINRTGVHARVSMEAIRYGGIAALISLGMMMVPAFLATRVTIVDHKRQLARREKPSVWHKYGLDLATVAVSLYGLYTYRSKLKTLQDLGLTLADLRMDPLHFVIPVLFIVGAGMVMLRIYPVLLKGLYVLGRKWWSPALYMTLVQAGRSAGQYHFLKVFLILTVANGVFSASAARTINNNVEDRVRYENGADVVLDVPWPQDGLLTDAHSSAVRPRYLEPDFEPYRELTGVEQAAKVFVKPDSEIMTDKGAAKVQLMGIDTDEFGRTAWFRNGLLDHHFHEYLNLMAGDTRAVLISQTLANQQGVKVGDPIRVKWTGLNEKTFTVYGIIPYFPTFNPAQGKTDDGEVAEAPMLIVGHLSRIQSQLAEEPYQVWLKLKPDASVKSLYEDMETRGLNATKITNTVMDLQRAKEEPFLMAINGVLTLGFMLSIAVSFVGFLLFWILILRGRVLQNGILRAMGLPLRSLVAMLAVEQLLTSGAALGIGALSGKVASLLFVPNFQSVFDSRSMVPPFRVMFEPVDSARLFLSVSSMVMIGLFILGFMISRIKIHQALKLGEE